MSLIIQISDTHFGTEQLPVLQALRDCIREQAPQLLVLSGDITQRARRSQFAAARAFIDSLPAIPLLALPGNHDIPLFNVAARMLAPYAGYRAAFGNALEPEFESTDLLALAVNTTRPYRHADGEVSKQQIERVARRLALAKPRQLRLVVTHQPICVTRPEDHKNLLHGHLPAMRRWAEAGADCVLGGHIHLPYVCALHEAGHGLARRIWAVQAGTALSSRVRHGAPNSINLIRHARNDMTCTVERWDFDSATQRFVPVTQHRLDLDRGNMPQQVATSE
ncbi:metallophosphoesterase family protein [Noviherbaspirillum pedocola]|uniref:Metallophosphoesterase n=1 Tax=Noviherbaspirillum pedocola TaxID=2801341 RepID=A0A934SWR1_9BURK|nr:metallophosphoesterase [Noviherbaspirillum pedocola]MBK4736848.1 metallophosphoesterase [Noviherbaspirillum pedocola]